MDLAQLFTPINFPAATAVKFPLDIVISGPVRSPAYSLYKNRIIRNTQDDYILVDTSYEEEFVLKAAPKMIIAAGVDRNLIVYDEAAKQGEFSTRLLALLRTVYRYNNSWHNNITDVFIDIVNLDDRLRRIANTFKIKINQCDMSVATEYFHRIGGKTPRGKDKLVIAVYNNNDSFVLPYQYDKYGLAITNGSSVLLGAY
jgi:hypothetical protein